MAKDTNELWNDAELASAVEAYVFMLRAERMGLEFSKEATAQLLLSGPLKNRNEGSVRYRMRNISAVVRDIGVPALKVYSPAEQVGANVRARLRSLLLANASFKEILVGTESSAFTEATSGELQKAALDRLFDLRSKIYDLERELIGIGHNRPPEPLHDGPSRAAFEDAYKDIEALEEELRKRIPSSDVSKRHINRLMSFGLKIALWAGERATKFTDLSLAILAPVVVAKATGLAPLLLDALNAVLRVVSH